MAKEYIEREAALDSLCTACEVVPIEEKEPCPYRFTGCQEYVSLFAAPAADVRPVVLCRDCKWCHAGYCEKYDDLIPFGCANKPWEDWFCADGKKREES